MVIGATMISTIDGFFGYNQVIVDEKDCYKTTFITPWGTSEYLRIPFGLMNFGSTFQELWIFPFETSWKIIEMYQYDLTTLSKERSSHVKD